MVDSAVRGADLSNLNNSGDERRETFCLQKRIMKTRTIKGGGTATILFSQFEKVEIFDLLKHWMLSKQV